jgi:hypothetical protein
VIGRAGGQVKPFELLRWARAQASAHHLRTLEAHVLLLLATYADKDAIAYPSIRTLALDSGLKPTKDGRNSAVSAALGRLQELQLVWTVQGGHGASARRELLFNPGQPSGPGDGCEREPHAAADGNRNGSHPDTRTDDAASLPATATVQPSGIQAQPSGLAAAAFRQAGPELPVTAIENGQGSQSASRTALSPSPDGNRKRLRRFTFEAVVGRGSASNRTEAA